MNIAQYHTDNKTTVVCVLHAKEQKGHYQNVSGKFVGKARCSKEDEFNLELGKLIAYERALYKLKMAEFAQAKKKSDEFKRLSEIYSKAASFNKKRAKRATKNLFAALRSANNE